MNLSKILNIGTNESAGIRHAEGVIWDWRIYTILAFALFVILILFLFADYLDRKQKREQSK